MASRGPTALDRWIAPVEIVAGANTLRIFNGLSVASVTIEPGLYWCHGETSGSVAIAYPGLYAALDAALMVAIWEGAAVSAWSPYQRRPGCGLQIQGGPHALLFSDPQFTFPRDLLGWPADWLEDTPTATVTRSPQTCRGIWVSPEAAWDKRSWPSRSVYQTSPDQPERSDAYQIVWGSRRIRTLVYSWLPAALVHKSRALLPEYARTAQLVAGDTAAAWEHTWEQLRELRDVLIVHDEGAVCGHKVASHPWEVVRLASGEGAERLDALVRLMSTGGEQYELAVPLVHLGGSYEQ